MPDQTIASRPEKGQQAPQMNWKLHPQIRTTDTESVLVHLHSHDLHLGQLLHQV